MTKTQLLAPDSKLRVILQPQYMVYIILLIMLIVANIVSPGYLSSYHLLSMLRIASFLGIACIGQNLCMLIGCIDMSVSSIIMLGNVMGAGILMGSDANLPLALLVALLSGAIAGFLTSVGVNFLNIPPFIMTLGMASIVEGFAMVYTNGAPKGASSSLLTKFTSMKTFGNVSGVIVVWLIVGVGFILLLKYTRIGRNIYALGSNPTGARFSGVNIVLTRTAVFTIAAVIYAFVGFLLVGYTGTTYLEVGDTYHPSNVAAVILGGTSVKGGKGGYVGTIAGALIMVILTDFLTILNVSEAVRQIVNGAILVILIIAYARDTGGER